MPLPRKLALDIIMRVSREESYSNLLLDSALERASLDGRDAAFVTALVYGDIALRGQGYRKASAAGARDSQARRISAHVYG